MFKPIGKKEEDEMLLKDNDSFAKTKKYLKPLIIAAMDYFVLSPEIETKILKKAINDMPIAAKRYLENSRNDKGYKFSTYFSWYVAQRMDKIENLKDKLKKGKKLP